MDIKKRLAILNFLEFFSWGSWLLSAGAYMVETLNFTGLQVGSVYATLGIASIFMPPLLGMVADKFLNAEKVFGICHLLLALLFLTLGQITDYAAFYVLMLLVSICYMPTLALNNSISYFNLENKGFDAVKTFPPIRVWGTVGFILAAWSVDALGFKVSSSQFYVGAVASFVLGLYAFTLPKVPVDNTEAKTIVQRFGLDAFKLFRNRNLAVFFIFSMLLGIALQVTNIWGVPFLNDFEIDYSDSFAVKHSVFLISLSQLSEVLFILAIPFFLKRYGIKKVVLMSMFAWMLRFALFAVGYPEGIGLVFLILSMLVYGMAFDFYFVSGSLYINRETSPKIRSSAQGLFMMMVNGIGFMLGAYASGIIVDFYTTEGMKDWPMIWFVFAIYAMVIGAAFAIFFRYKHKKDVEFN
ncbi:nucleoside permease [Maribacter sp. 2210JD10-5]|uniref:nucleoside permease n=1 Tax=Maribacter sp. 2210JD10-5 TaxID=3386272 RepID=UPI0039BCCBA1